MFILPYSRPYKFDRKLQFVVRFFCSVLKKDKLQNEILNRKKTLIYKKIQLIYFVTKNGNTLALLKVKGIMGIVGIRALQLRT